MVLVGSVSAANSFLLSPRASEYSFVHQPEPSQFADTGKVTASQRLAASCNARSQRCPAAMPRSGSRSRKTSFQPSEASQPHSAIASKLSLLEWLTNMRDIQSSLDRNRTASPKLVHISNSKNGCDAAHNVKSHRTRTPRRSANSLT